VISDAKQAGLRLLSDEKFLPFHVFLIFGLDARPPTAPAGRRPPRPGR
jgi:hypothetical protein